MFKPPQCESVLTLISITLKMKIPLKIFLIKVYSSSETD